MRTKTPCPELKAETEFKGQWSDLEVYIFDLGPRYSDKFYSTMKEMEQYLGETYSYICQPGIMIDIQANFSDTWMPTIIPDAAFEHPKTDVDMTYLKKNNIDESFRQKMRNKDVYKNNTRNKYINIVGHKNEQPQEKAALNSNFQAVNTGQYPIGYLTMLNKFCLSNQY